MADELLSAASSALPMAGPYGIAAGVALKGVQLGMASARKNKAARELARLRNIPLPRFSAGNELTDYYNQAKGEVANAPGFTGAERTGFYSTLSDILGTRFANATSTAGGQISRAVRGMNVGDAVRAGNQFAGQDAGIRRTARNMAFVRLGSATTALQRLKDQNTQLDVNRRLETERALGTAVSQNQDIVGQGIGDIGSDLFGAGLNLTAYNSMNGPSARTPGSFSRSELGMGEIPIEAPSLDEGGVPPLRTRIPANPSLTNYLTRGYPRRYSVR